MSSIRDANLLTMLPFVLNSNATYHQFASVIADQLRKAAEVLTTDHGSDWPYAGPADRRQRHPGRCHQLAKNNGGGTAKAVLYIAQELEETQ